MTPLRDCVEVEGFDREYGLADLFPETLARDLLAVLDGRCRASILLPDGTVHYGAGATASDGPPILKRRTPNGPQPLVWIDGGRRRAAVELVHQLERIGCLVLDADAAHVPEDQLAALCQFTAGCIHRVIDLNHRIRMTAGLHGQVVADSYAALKRKAAALAASEARYRHLAGNLEIEVAKKTREIEAAQLRLLQQEKMAAIGQLAAGMAHEINNPVGFVISNLNTLRATLDELAALIGSYRRLEAMLTGRQPASEVKAQLATIDGLIREMDLDFILGDTQELIEESLDGAKRVKIIVQNLREFAHPSTETAESLDVNACLDTTLAILSSHVLPGITVTRRYGALPRLVAHLREINQVFFNILKNAFQAVGEQGSVEIRTAVDGDAVAVVIADTGTGIDPRHLGSIFDPFFTTREVGSGTGLGLFQAYSTVKRHGGTIGAESTVGAGSTFTVRLPISPRGDVDADPPIGATPTSTHRKSAPCPD